MNHFRRRQQNLVIFIYDYCQNQEEVDLSFVSRRALRQQNFIDLGKAKRAIEDGRFPQLLRRMLYNRQHQQRNSRQERRLRQSFAVADW